MPAPAGLALEYKTATATATEEHAAAQAAALLAADDEQGLVTAIVSVTGIKDQVNDVIMPGAYRKTLAKRRPKGIWSHGDRDWIASAEEVIELMPGDPRLPKALRDGAPWPADAGALLVKARFNLKTTKGRDAYQDVKFFSERGECEWSIGYQVPRGGAKTVNGTRYIKELELYEFSPVLFGAHNQTRTLAVKSLGATIPETKDGGCTCGGGAAPEAAPAAAEPAAPPDAEPEAVPNVEPEPAEPDPAAPDAQPEDPGPEPATGAEEEGPDPAVQALFAAAEDEIDWAEIDAATAELAAARQAKAGHWEAGEHPRARDGEFARVPGAGAARAASRGFGAVHDNAPPAPLPGSARHQPPAVDFDATKGRGEVDPSDLATGDVIKLGSDYHVVRGAPATAADGIDLPAGRFNLSTRMVGATTTVHIPAGQKVKHLGVLGHKSAAAEETKGFSEPEMAFLRAVVEGSLATGAQLPVHSWSYLDSKRAFSTAERQQLAGRGHALPDGSYPIEDVASLKDAIAAFGRGAPDAKRKAAIRRHIIARARALGHEELIPDSWKTTKALAEAEAAPAIPSWDTKTEANTTGPDGMETRNVDDQAGTADTSTETETETGTASGVDLQTKAEGGADRNRGGAEKLRRYWVSGEGAAKIRWGEPGDFNRCVRLVSKYMDPERAKGYCNLRHRDATGAAPGHAPSEMHKSYPGGEQTTPGGLIIPAGVVLPSESETKAYPFLVGSDQERLALLGEAVTEVLRGPAAAEGKASAWDHVSIDGTYADRVIATRHRFGENPASETWQLSAQWDAKRCGFVLSEPEQVELRLAEDTGDGGEPADHAPMALLAVVDGLERALVGVKTAALLAPGGGEEEPHWEVKAGRVLSSVNGSKLRAAFLALREVLAKAGLIDPEEESGGGNQPDPSTDGPPNDSTAPGAQIEQVKSAQPETAQRVLLPAELAPQTKLAELRALLAAD